MKHIFAMGTDQARSKFDALCQMFFKKFETFAPTVQMPGREEGIRARQSQSAVGVTHARRGQSSCTSEQF